MPHTPTTIEFTDTTFAFSESDCIGLIRILSSGHDRVRDITSLVITQHNSTMRRDCDIIKDFLHALTECHNLTKLDISGLTIGNEGAKILADSLKHCPNLSEVAWGTSCYMNEEGLEALAKTLHRCQNLVKVNFGHLYRDTHGAIQQKIIDILSVKSYFYPTDDQVESREFMDAVDPANLVLGFVCAKLLSSEGNVASKILAGVDDPQCDVLSFAPTVHHPLVVELNLDIA